MNNLLRYLPLILISSIGIISASYSTNESNSELKKLIEKVEETQDVKVESITLKVINKNVLIDTVTIENGNQLSQETINNLNNMKDLVSRGGDPGI